MFPRYFLESVDFIPIVNLDVFRLGGATTLSVRDLEGRL